MSVRNWKFGRKLLLFIELLRKVRFRLSGLRQKSSFSGTELSGSDSIIIPTIRKEYALKVTRTLCEVREFGDVEMISKNKNCFPKLPWGLSGRGTYCFYDKKVLA